MGFISWLDKYYRRVIKEVDEAVDEIAEDVDEAIDDLVEDVKESISDMVDGIADGDDEPDVKNEVYKARKLTINGLYRSKNVDRSYYTEDDGEDNLRLRNTRKETSKTKYYTLCEGVIKTEKGRVSMKEVKIIS
jgi:hypothetical protein